MDINTIIIIVGFSSMFVERVFTWMNRIKKSKCLGAEVEMKEDNKIENKI
jgi:hypothetical protein